MSKYIETEEILDAIESVGVEVSSVKTYSKLLGKLEYDHEVVEQLAEALQELETIESRSRYLRELVDMNRKDVRFVWKTAEGSFIPYHKITDDHLKNIVKMFLIRGLNIPKEVKRLALTRGISFDAASMSNEKYMEAKAIMERA